MTWSASFPMHRRKRRSVLFRRCLIPLCLRRKEFIVFSVCRHQLGVVSDLLDRSVVQHNNFVCCGGAWQSVGHENGGLALSQIFKLCKNLLLCDGIKGGCGFVKYQNIWVCVKSSGDGNFLPLTDGKFCAILVKILYAFLNADSSWTGQLPQLMAVGM